MKLTLKIIFFIKMKMKNIIVTTSMFLMLTTINFATCSSTMTLGGIDLFVSPKVNYTLNNSTLQIGKGGNVILEIWNERVVVPKDIANEDS